MKHRSSSRVFALFLAMVLLSGSLPQPSAASQVGPAASHALAGGMAASPPGSGTSVTSGSTVVGGGWSRTGDPQSFRSGALAATLNDGRVLVAGGCCQPNAPGTFTYASSELYDPATGVWSSTDSLNQTRYLPSWTVLADGRVFVSGGRDASAILETSSHLDSAEIYSPASGGWTSVAPIPDTQIAHGVVQLTSGTVLVAGGGCDDSGNCGPGTRSNRTYLYNLATNSWTSTGSMSRARMFNSPGSYGGCGYIFALPNGKAIAGGTAMLSTANGLDAEIYSEASGVWTPVPGPQLTEVCGTAVQLGNGNVLVLGRAAGSNVYSAATYDWNSNTWSPVVTTSLRGWIWQYPGMVRLAGGSILGLADIEQTNSSGYATVLFDPSTSSWTTLPNAPERGIAYESFVALNDGRALYSRHGFSTPCADCAAYLFDANLPIVAVSFAPESIAATDVFTIRVQLRNSSQATDAMTLTLTEGPGLTFAPGPDASFGRIGGAGGVNNLVYFDSWAFGPSEQKSFTLSLIATPPPDLVLPGVVTATLGAVDAAGRKGTAELSMTVIDAGDLPPIGPEALRLTAMPVNDAGGTPDAPFGAAATFRTPSVVFPSDQGQFWDYYIDKSLDKWDAKDRVLYYYLKKAGLSARTSYGILYLKAVKELLTKKPGITQFTLKKIAIRFWYGVQLAKWTGETKAIKEAFKDIAKELDFANAMYLLNLIELTDNFSEPLISAMQDRLAALGSTDRSVQQEIVEYVINRTPMNKSPFPRLIEADVDYRLSRGHYHTKLHGAVLRLVPLKVSGGGMTTLGQAIEEVINECAVVACPGSGSLQAYRRAWVEVQVHSPLLPLVTDGIGKKAGIDPATGTVYSEIPGAVIQPGHPWELLLPTSNGQQYSIVYSNAYPYIFGVDVLGLFDGVETSSTSFGGFAGAGYQATQTVSIQVAGNKVTATPSAMKGNDGRTIVPGAFASTVYLSAVQIGKSLAGPTPTGPAPEWLNVLNAARAQVGLPTVTENPDWMVGAVAHSKYMVKNDAISHFEITSNQYYTVEGDDAARAGIIGLNGSATISDADVVKEFFRRPFHMLTILNPNLIRTALGSYREGKTGVTIDVVRGARGPAPDNLTLPLVWPGKGSTVDLTSYPGQETPDPLTSCPGYTAPAGLPILVFTGRPNLSQQTISSSISKDGAPVEHCWFDGFTYTNPTFADQENTRVQLQNQEAIVLIPRVPLQKGATYNVSVTIAGKTTAWSFSVSS